MSCAPPARVSRIIVPDGVGSGSGVVTLIAADVAAVIPDEVKLSVREPSAPEMDRSVNVATPAALVVAGVVPPSVPPPVAIAAATETPDWLTLLPDTSRSWTTGCRGNATPPSAFADGCVVIASWVAEPAVMLMAVDVTLVNDVPEKLRVRDPMV